MTTSQQNPDALSKESESKSVQPNDRRCAMVIERPANVDPARPHELVVVQPKEGSHNAKGKSRL